MELNLQRGKRGDEESLSPGAVRRDAETDLRFPPSLPLHTFSRACTLSLFPYTQTLPLFPLSLPRFQALSPAFSSVLHLRLPTTLFCHLYGLFPPEANLDALSYYLAVLGKYTKCAFNQQVSCYENHCVMTKTSEGETYKETKQRPMLASGDSSAVTIGGPNQWRTQKHAALYLWRWTLMKNKTRRPPLIIQFDPNKASRDTCWGGECWTLIHLSLLTGSHHWAPADSNHYVISTLLDWLI